MYSDVLSGTVRSDLPRGVFTRVNSGYRVSIKKYYVQHITRAFINNLSVFESHVHEDFCAQFYANSDFIRRAYKRYFASTHDLYLKVDTSLGR